MTGSYVGDMLVIVAVAFLVGVLLGCTLFWRRVELLVAFLLTTAISAVILGILWFLWVAITTAIYGHPAGHNPLLVALGAVGLQGIGIAMTGAVPSILGCLAAYALLKVFRRRE